MTFSDETFAAARQWQQAQIDASKIYGYPGKLRAGSTNQYDFNVPGKPGMWYVRIWRGEELTIDEAFNQGALPNPFMMCVMERENGRLVIRRPDPVAAANIYGTNAQSAAVPPIISGAGTGNTMPIQSNQLMMGMITQSAAGGLSVRVWPFFHEGGYWDGGDELTLVPTATSGMQAFVLVSLDPKTNTLHQTLGADFSLATPTLWYPALVQQIVVPVGHYPLGAVLLRESDTVITSSTPIIDRRWFLQARGKYEIEPLREPVEVEIASGEIDVTQQLHTVETEGGASSDDLDTINVPDGDVGYVFYLRPADDTHTVTLKDGTGNIVTWDGSDITLDEEQKLVRCVYDPLLDVVIAEAVGTGGGGSIDVTDGTTTVSPTTTLGFDGLGFEVMDQGSGVAEVVRKSSDAQVSIAPQAWIVGFEVNHDGTNLTVAPGAARATTDDYTLVLTAPVTIDPGTTGANGLDTGSLANSTWYYVWVIANSSTNATAALLSTSSTSPTMPSGYDRRRRVGALKTNGSAALYRVRTEPGGGLLRDVYYLEDLVSAPFILADEVNVGGGTAYNWSDIDCSALAPPLSRFVLLYVSSNSPGSGPGARILWREKGTNQIMPIVTVPATSSFDANTVWVPVDADQVGQWASTSTFDEDGALNFMGYRDNLTPTIVGTSSPDVETTDGAPLDASYVVEDANGSLTDEVLTTTLINTGAIGSLPSAAKAARLYLPNNAPYLFRDTGAAQTPFLGLRQVVRPVEADTSWVNQGTTVISSSNGGVLLIAPPAAPPNLRGRIMAAPSTPWAVEAAFSASVIGAGDGLAGLWFREGSTGLLHTFGWNGIKVVISKYNNAASFNSDYTTQDVWLALPYGLIWMRIEDNGTNRLCRVSADGYTWSSIHVIGRTDFMTANQIGFFVQAPSNTAGTQTQMNLLHWSVT